MVMNLFVKETFFNMLKIDEVQENVSCIFTKKTLFLLVLNVILDTTCNNGFAVVFGCCCCCLNTFLHQLNTKIFSWTASNQTCYYRFTEGKWFKNATCQYRVSGSTLSHFSLDMNFMPLEFKYQVSKQESFIWLPIPYFFHQLIGKR